MYYNKFHYFIQILYEKKFKKLSFKLELLENLKKCKTNLTNSLIL